MPAGSNESVSNYTGENGFATCLLGTDPGDASATRRAERTGRRTRSRTRSRMDRRRQPAARCGNRGSSSAFSAAGGAPIKKRRGTDAHPAGAVDLLRMRVPPLRAGEDRAPSTRRWLCRTVTEICLDCSAALLMEVETRRRRPRQRHGDHRRDEFSVSGSDGQSASEERRCRAGNERRYAGLTSGKEARWVGHAQATGELEAAANVQRLAVSCLDRALLAQAGPGFPVPAEHRAENFGRSLRRAEEWPDNDRDGYHRAAVPRRRGIGPRRGRMERGASSRSGSRNLSELCDSKPTGHDGGGGAPKPPPLAGSVEAALRSALEAVERVSELSKESGRSQSTRKRRRPAQCSGPTPRREKGKSKGRGKRQRRQSEKDRTSRMNSNDKRRRGCLADGITASMLRDDGLYIGRSRSVLGGTFGKYTTLRSSLIKRLSEVVGN